MFRITWVVLKGMQYSHSKNVLSLLLYILQFNKINLKIYPPKISVSKIVVAGAMTSVSSLISAI
jgi:hypothetical protein